MRLSWDPLTRWWWRIVGRPVDLDGEHAWLDAPTSRTSHVDDQAWIADWAERIGGTAVRGGSDAGLIPAMEALDGPGLDVSRLAAPVRDFYEHTSRWHMDVWAEWSPLFWPAGELVSRLFAKRIQQLALPMRALDVAHGMDSSVTVIHDASGDQASAGWIRQLRSTGDPVFSGAYRTNRLPSSDRASVRHLPVGERKPAGPSAPEDRRRRSLWLDSPPGGFGEDGAYVLVRFGRRHFAARVPPHESFHLYLDGGGCCGPTTCAGTTSWSELTPAQP